MTFVSGCRCPDDESCVKGERVESPVAQQLCHDRRICVCPGEQYAYPQRQMLAWPPALMCQCVPSHLYFPLPTHLNISDCNEIILLHQMTTDPCAKPIPTPYLFPFVGNASTIVIEVCDVHPVSFRFLFIFAMLAAFGVSSVLLKPPVTPE